MSYYAKRSGSSYYRLVQQWLEEFGPLDSVLDVGCFDTPVATWGDFQRRITVDSRPRPALDGVLQIIGYWPDCSHMVPVCDIVLCLQVLEHLEDPKPFTQTLFEHAGRAVIISVPWLWPEGRYKGHKQDPVDEKKLLSWTGRKPDRFEIVAATDKVRRAVALYELSGITAQ